MSRLGWPRADAERSLVRGLLADDLHALDPFCRWPSPHAVALSLYQGYCLALAMYIKIYSTIASSAIFLHVLDVQFSSWPID